MKDTDTGDTGDTEKIWNIGIQLIEGYKDIQIECIRWIYGLQGYRG